MRIRPLAAALAIAVSVPSAAAAHAGDADVAALQVGLRAAAVYSGPVDGSLDAAVSEAVAEIQRRAGLAVDGISGHAVRAALGDYGRFELGSRVIAVPARGWDVAAVQFLIAWHGFPSGPINGSYTERTRAAVLRFQRWARLAADGVVGGTTLTALRADPPRSPLPLSSPLELAHSGSFGPRGDRFHTGIDFPAAAGTPVAAARAGRVTYAGWHPGGWGYLVTIAHGQGVRTMYAHLSRIDVRVGQRVGGGEVVGAVGSSGNSFGPHLHFEVRLRGAAVDPAEALALSVR